MAVTETVEGMGLEVLLWTSAFPPPVVNCSITWATFVAGDYNLLMLVEIVGPASSVFPGGQL